MKKAAILIDGEWFRRVLDTALTGNTLPHGITADIMYRNALLAIDPQCEEIFRIFYYDCPPFSGEHTNPIDHSRVNFKLKQTYQARTKFLAEMKCKDFVAMRLGVVKMRGWTLTNRYTKQAIQGTTTPPAASDVFLGFEQKGVDMRIGIDVATLALKRIVDRIILISGDTDMIPAIKLARREGVQVILVELDSTSCPPISKALEEDVDLIREITAVI